MSNRIRSASLSWALIAGILIGVGASAGCRRVSPSDAAASASPASTVAPAPPDSEPPPDPEIARQIQQVADALSKAEAALQGIYEKKKKAHGVLTGALQDFLDDDTRGQSSKMEKANAILRDQNRSKDAFAKRQAELRKLEKSPYPEVQRAAAAALRVTQEKAKRFEKGLPPNS